MKKLAIVTTHPIQYNAPVFKLLTERKNIAIKVFYTWGESVLQNKFDPGFGKVIEWDIPLLQGYEFTMVENVSNQPGSHHYNGIVNPNLNKDIEAWGADAVLIFGWNFKSHFSCMRYFHGKIPVLFRGDSTLLDQGKNIIKNGIRKLVLNFVYKFVDQFLYTGVANSEYYKNAGVKKDKLIFTPHAIDNSRFSKSVQIDFREKNNIPKDNILFLYAGKFEEKKNVGLLIDAFAELSSRNISLLLIGNGPQENNLKTKVDQLTPQKKNNIHFLDFQNQTLMPDVYQCCDVFVLPSKGPGETWGLAINEAMASSKPVLVSDKCGAAQDLVHDGVNGYTFESDNVQSLISKMEMLIAQKDQLDFMGKQSSLIIKDWSFEKICMAIENTVNTKKYIQ